MIRTAGVRGILCAFALLGQAGSGFATTARDPTTTGPWVAKSGEYKFPATTDALVTTFLKTELWAKVWYPTGKAFTRAPIAILVHGNHGTCGRMVTFQGKQYRVDDRTDYSTSGTCPAGYQVTPNHTGYDYVAQRLATNGYVVVSINTNRGITAAPEDSRENDPGLIQRRGRMILRHLMLLGQWNANGGQPSSIGFNMKGKLNFNKVTLFGHSRGGDGIVAAYNLYKTSSTWRSRLPAITFVGIASMAPTDFQTNHPGVIGAPLSVLLPMCDGDVNRLSGIHFYDRSIVSSTPDTSKNYKSVFATWGANHNGYNTQWQTEDQYQAASRGCPDQNQLFQFPIGLSPSQQAIGRYYLMAVARGGSESSTFAQLLNPAFSLPSFLSSLTRIDRSFFVGRGARSLRLVRFDGSCGSKVNVTDGVQKTGVCTTFPEHQPDPVALIRWGKPATIAKDSNHAIFTINKGIPVNFGTLKTLDLRVAPDCFRVTPNGDFACGDRSHQGFGTGSQGISIFLEDAAGHFSKPLLLSNYVARREAVGVHSSNGVLPVDPLYHAILSSARIPVASFSQAGFSLSAVKKIWLYLGDKNSSGGLFFGDIWGTSTSSTGIDGAIAPVEEAAPEAVAENAAGASVIPPPDVQLTPVSDGPASDQAGAVAAQPAPVVPADPGNRILSATRGTLRVAVDNPPEGATPEAVPTREIATVELTISTATQIVEGDSAVQVRIGNSLIQARRFGTGRENNTPSVTKIVVPATAVDAATDGASLAILSGGRVWQFGPFSRSAIR